MTKQIQGIGGKEETGVSSLAASREFEVAYEGIGINHSVLTEALLPGLDQKNQKNNSGEWVTNYSVVETIKQHLPKFPQLPIFGNSGG